MNYKKQNYKDTYLYKNEKEEVKKYIEIYLNNKKIDLEYKFKEAKEYKILIKFKRPLTNMSYMFFKSSSLTSFNLSNFNTNNVNDMRSMFYECSSLTSLNLSNFNTKNVTNMIGIFEGLNNNCNIISNDEKIIHNKFNSPCFIF